MQAQKYVARHLIVLAGALALALSLAPLAARADDPAISDDVAAAEANQPSRGLDDAPDDGARGTEGDVDDQPGESTADEQHEPSSDETSGGAAAAENAYQVPEEGIAVSPAPMLGAPSRADETPQSVSAYLYYYKVAGFYSTSVGPSVYGGGRWVTIDSERPVGFEKDMQFEALYDNYKGHIRVGHKVTTENNPYRWTCVGFVPVPGDPGYGFTWVRDHYLKEYCFGTVEEGEAFVNERGGVLYGEVPSEELIDTLSGYPAGRGLIVVWSRALPSLPEQNYEYGDPIIDDAQPVDWQPTTNGVAVEGEVTSESIDGQMVGTVVYTVTIPEGMDEDVLNIDLAEVPLPSSPGFQPGDDLHYKVIVRDESGRRYAYLEGTGSLGTTLSDSTDPVSIGFERYDISRPNSSHEEGRIMCFPGGWRIYNIALDELYGAVGLSHRDTSDPNDEQNQLGDTRIGWALALAGYTYHPDDDLVKGITGMDDVDEAWQDLQTFLGYLSTAGLTLDDAAYYGLLTSDKMEGIQKVLADLTQNRLDDYYLDWMNDRHHNADGAEGEGPWFTTFKDAPENLLWELMNGISNGSMPESNRSVANAIYYAFYEYFYPAASRRGGDPEGIYSIMREPVQADPLALPDGYDSSLATGNGYDDELLAQWDEAGESATEHELGWWHHISGHANGNATQDTVFFVCAQFKLVKPVVEVRVSKVWSDQDDKDGVRPASVSVRLLEGGEASGRDAITLDEGNEWTGGWDRLSRYANNEAVSYTVEESPVPSGYTCAVSYESDDDGNVLATMTNSHTPKEPPVPDNPPVPRKPKKTGGSIPVTGDRGLAVAMLLVTLSAAAIACAMGLRTVSQNKRGDL